MKRFKKTLVNLSEEHLHELAQGLLGIEELAGEKHCATTKHCSKGFETKPLNHCHCTIVCAIHWFDLVPKNNGQGDESHRKQKLVVHGNFPGGTAGSTCTCLQKVEKCSGGCSHNQHSIVPEPTIFQVSPLATIHRNIQVQALMLQVPDHTAVTTVVRPGSTTPLARRRF